MSDTEVLKSKNVIDVRYETFDQLAQAVADSEWIPKDASVDDWTYEAAEFLRTGSGPWEIWAFYETDNGIPVYTWRDGRHPELGERVRPMHLATMACNIDRLQKEVQRANLKTFFVGIFFTIMIMISVMG